MGKGEKCVFFDFCKEKEIHLNEFPLLIFFLAQLTQIKSDGGGKPLLCKGIN